MSVNQPHRNTLSVSDGTVTISRINPKTAQLHVDPGAGRFATQTDWTTQYPDELIKSILNAKGACSLIDEVMRDECREYVQRALYWGLFAFIAKEQFQGKRLLDFGCGSGASTCILARQLPQTELVGIDLDSALLQVAQQRATYYGYSHRVTLVASPDPRGVPDDIGKFDYVLFSAVFEHLLPAERHPLLTSVWSTLVGGGVLFINQTPNRRSFVEYHTTLGLPLINYLPDWLAERYARSVSRRGLRDSTWEELLRAGIRGATRSELSAILESASPGGYEFVPPNREGVRDEAELWYRSTSLLDARSVRIKQLIRTVARIAGPFRPFILPGLVLAVRKTRPRT